MAIVKGIKEKVHLPLYDSISVKARERLGVNQSSNIMRFFQDVTGKTKLQTNMQASSLLPHWNTFEARALRVVVSDLSPQFPAKPTVDLNQVQFLQLSTDQSKPYQKVPLENGSGEPLPLEKMKLLGLTLDHYVRLSRMLEKSNQRTLQLPRHEIETLSSANRVGFEPDSDKIDCVEIGWGDVEELGSLLKNEGAKLPPGEQVVPNNGNGNLISRFIYNTVTTFFVGEKVMIQVPTWFFPSGAGPYAEDGSVVTHGYPSPQATFRFAEPIFIDTQQNFRIEIEFSENEVLSDFQNIYGPLFIWVVVDGYMTRDVQ